MPRREDINSILIIGSGPIVIGQACEFDYSGTQACRVLRSEGYRVILANSNPATIMTDPEVADVTYLEPLDVDVIASILKRERPDALLATLGGQTGLNLAMQLEASGTLDELGTQLIGANAQAIATAEDRHLFKQAMIEIGLEVPRSGIAKSRAEAHDVLAALGLPVIIRPAYILGGSGAGIATTAAEFELAVAAGLEASPIREILIEESIVGWKEYELEVMRDRHDNCVVVCSIENLDPMGVHTGDSITVAPAQTLSDTEYQKMRNAAFAVLRRVGVETGGSNVQFAVNPADGRQVVIEMNPRVSRSSALASKATGFPIAKIAARLAVGYTLDEIPNDITAKTPASFEPTLDYVVTKIPRWSFEKFDGTSGVLGTSMQSVGEVMALGRTFCESLQKGIRSLEHGRLGLNGDSGETAYESLSDAQLLDGMTQPTRERLFQLEVLIRRGVSIDTISSASGIDRWFLEQIARISEARMHLSGCEPHTLSRMHWRRVKQLGFSDAQLAYILGSTPDVVRQTRTACGVTTTYKTVDTCAAEFEATTPYHYSTYEDTSEVQPAVKPRVVICGSVPNRIGQGVEFDYCCVHAGEALREAGFETVMINCNPETVSTDYDANDRLYFEPLTAEDVDNVIAVEQPVGVIVSLGGQTPLSLASGLDPELVLGTPVASIDLAEDRQLWSALCRRIGIPQPAGATVSDANEAVQIAEDIGFPVLLRPSYVLGGRAMTIAYDTDELRGAIAEMGEGGLLHAEGGPASQRPVLVDRFLEDAIEVDVDAVRDHTGEVFVAAVMEHVERAGVHSGDSACSIPATTLSAAESDTICNYTRLIAEALGVVGLLNVQFAVRRSSAERLDGTGSTATPDSAVPHGVYVLEANPRASRTVPFVSKATGIPLAKVAARLMVGATLRDLSAEQLMPAHAVGDDRMLRTSRGFVAVKEVVLPFDRFPDTDAVLGPEMHSTGEVVAIDVTPGLAFLKAQFAAGTRLRNSGTVFMSMANRDKPAGLRAGRIFEALGFRISATAGTADFLQRGGVSVFERVARLGEHTGRHAVDLIEAGEVQLVINSPQGRGSRADGAHIRAAAGRQRVPLFTTAAAALAAAQGLRDLRWRGNSAGVVSLQECHRLLQAQPA